MGTVTARFTADFATFNDAVQKASVNLDTFDSSVKGVGDRLQRSFDQFSGRAVVEQATLMTKAIEDLGGVTKLTADEQDKAAVTLQTYIDKQTALGQAIPDNVKALHDQITATQDARAAEEQAATQTQQWTDTLKGAIENPTQALKDFGKSAVDTVAEMGPLGQAAGVIATVAAAAGAAMIELANQAAEAAAKLYEIHEMTGMTVPAVSALGYAFEAAGGSVEGLTTLLYTFEQRMDTAGPKVESGLAQIGLSLAQIQAMPADERITAISDALRSAGDDTNKAAVAMEIFGKQGRENLPLLLKPLSDLADEAHKVGAVMSDEDAKSAEDYEATLRDLTTQTTANWEAIGRQLTIGRDLSTVWGVLKLGASDFAKSLLDLANSIQTWNNWLPAIHDQLHGLFQDLPTVTGDAAAGVKKAFDTTATAIKPVTLGTSELAGVIREETDAANKSIEAHKKAAEALDKYNAIVREVIQSSQGFGAVVDTIDGAVVEATRYYVAHGASLQQVGEMYGLTKVQIQALGEQFKFEQAAADATTKTIDKYTQSHQVALPTVSGLSDDAYNLAAGLDDESRAAHQAEVEQNALNDLLKQQATTRNTLNDAIAKQAVALPGLGSAIKTEASSWTDALKVSDKEISELTTGFRDLAQVSGGAFKGIVQDVGNVVASFGLAQKAVEQFHAATTAAGKVTAAASGGAAVLQATGTGGVGSRVLGGAATGAELGSLAGPEGAAIGAAAGAAVGLVRGLTGPSQTELSGRQLEAQYEQSFGGFQQMVTAVGQAYAATGKTMQQAQADVKSMLDAERQGPDAVQGWIDKLSAATDAFGQQDAAIQSAEDAAQRYGITLAELGPALQKQELDKQAQQLYSDFQTLTAAGVDTNTVLEHMSGSVNDYVHNALTMGQEVPDAMEPMLEKMAEAGELTDANGNKIDDLSQSGISFSMTMSEGFTKLIDSVNQLTTVLSHGLGGALSDTTSKINAIPKSVDVAVNYTQTTTGTAPSGTDDVPGYATGTDGKFVDFGAGSLVMLHGKEAVVPQDAPLYTAGSLSDGSTAASSAAPTIIINAQGSFLDTPGDLQKLADKVNAALTAKYGLIGNRTRAA